MTRAAYATPEIVSRNAPAAMATAMRLLEVPSHSRMAASEMRWVCEAIAPAWIGRPPERLTPAVTPTPAAPKRDPRPPYRKSPVTLRQPKFVTLPPSASSIRASMKNFAAQFG